MVGNQERGMEDQLGENAASLSSFVRPQANVFGTQYNTVVGKVDSGLTTLQAIFRAHLHPWGIYELSLIPVAYHSWICECRQICCDTGISRSGFCILSFTK
jgi:hypothetical protein